MLISFYCLLFVSIVFVSIVFVLLNGIKSKVVIRLVSIIISHKTELRVHLHDAEGRG